MHLTESQLFTIEALNRIDGFVWPENAKFAAIDCNDKCVEFYSLSPRSFNGRFTTSRFRMGEQVEISSNSPNWRGSLISKKQFDSVDGWVHDNVYPKKMNVTVIESSDGDYKWRYHKPTKEAEMHNPETKRPTLLEILVRELPKRGGWPDGAKIATQHCDELSPIKPSVLFGDGDSFSKFGLLCVRTLGSAQLASDYKGKIVTKAEYLEEIARVGAGKDLNKWNDEVMDMTNKISIDDINNPEMKLSHNEIKERVSACFRGDYAESYKIESIDSLYARYELAKKNTKAGRDELARLEEEEYKLFGEIERWNEERGFSVIDISDRQEKKELVITDWLDLRVGDVIKAILVVGVDGFNGKYGEVIRIDINAIDGPLLTRFDGGIELWVNEWEFIRRP